jgi:hypothetical protein
MKKVCFVFIAIIIANLTFAAEGGDLDNQFYFRLGASIPSWKYMGADDKNDWVVDDIKRGGGIFEMGNIFMLNGLKLADGMRIGINVDYLCLSYNRFKSKDMQEKFTFFFWGAKFGPSFSYSPVDKISFDTYIKFNPVWLSTAFDAPYKADDDWDKLWSLGFFGPKLSVGLNVHLSVLIIGVEYNPGIVKYNEYDNDNDEFTDEYVGNYMDPKDDGDYTKVPCFNITAGFSF